MKIQTVLFPTDFSHDNDAALEYASTLAKESGATLHIFHVYDATNLSVATGEASYLYAVSWEEELEAARKKLGTIRPTTAGVHHEHHCVVGQPDEEIVTFADERKVDLIVMSSHGRSGFSRLLMGSVAESVMRRASCPVLIVKQPARKREVSPVPAASGPTTGNFS